MLTVSFLLKEESQWGIVIVLFRTKLFMNIQTQATNFVKIYRKQ